MSAPDADAQRPAHLDDLRASQDRDLRRVGIPMILALCDETAGQPGRGDGPVSSADPPPNAATVADGQQLVTRLDVLRTDLAPGQRDDDLGVLVSLLTVAAHLDFGKGNEEERR
ncbi:MAG: hypothetical protein ABJA87_05430 [bacterium]